MQWRADWLVPILCQWVLWLTCPRLVWAESAAQPPKSQDAWLAPQHDLATLIEAFGSHQGKAEVQFTIAQSNREYEQQNTYRWEINADHHRHLHWQTPLHSLELWHRQPVVLIRLDTGKIREKNEREMDVEQLANLGPLSFLHCLSSFGQMKINREEILQWDGYEAERFSITAAASNSKPVALPDPWRHPSALHPPLAGWREQAQVRDVIGKVVVEKSRGLLLQAEIDGRLDIVDQKSEPSQLRLRCQHRLSKLGKANPIKFPSKIIPELRRSQRSKDPLAFFRSELPVTPPSK